MQGFPKSSGIVRSKKTNSIRGGHSTAHLITSDDLGWLLLKQLWPDDTYQSTDDCAIGGLAYTCQLCV